MSAFFVSVCPRATLLGAAVLVLMSLAQPARAQAEPGGDAVRIALPPHLPATCIAQASADYAVPATIMLAIVQVESAGRSVVARNANNSLDIGVAQHNTNSWVPYFERRYGIDRQSLLDSPCQSMRAQAYVLRMEMNSKECGGTDVWCAVGRYHAPNNMAARAVYVPKVRAALDRMLRAGRFEGVRTATRRGASRPAEPAPRPVDAERAERAGEGASQGPSGPVRLDFGAIL